MTKICLEPKLRDRTDYVPNRLIVLRLEREDQDFFYGSAKSNAHAPTLPFSKKHWKQKIRFPRLPVMRFPRLKESTKEE